jgi:hypothetical protein
MSKTFEDRPVSLSVLWQHWQELEEVEHGEKEFAEFNAIEERMLNQPAGTAADLLAKISFQEHLARDAGWDERIEKLYASIKEDQRNQLDHQDAMTQLEVAIRHVEGVAECLVSVAQHAPDAAKVCEYLGDQLLEHVGAAKDAFDNMGVENYTKGTFLKNATKPKPQDAQRDLANLVLSAWPGITVCEVESVREMLKFMLNALPEEVRGSRMTGWKTEEGTDLKGLIPDSLAAAEKEIGELWAKSRTSSEANEVQEPITKRIFALEGWIAKTAPTTLAEVAIKLRRMADPYTGIDAGESADGSDAVSARQMLAFVEANLAPGEAAP